MTTRSARYETELPCLTAWGELGSASSHATLPAGAI